MQTNKQINWKTANSVTSDVKLPTTKSTGEVEIDLSKAPGPACY